MQYILHYLEHNKVHSELAHCSGLTKNEFFTLIESLKRTKHLRQSTKDKFEKVARGYAKIEGIPYDESLITKLFSYV